MRVFRASGVSWPYFGGVAQLTTPASKAVAAQIRMLRILRMKSSLTF
jgi:hypothetical protein